MTRCIKKNLLSISLTLPLGLIAAGLLWQVGATGCGNSTISNPNTENNPNPTVSDIIPSAAGLIALPNDFTLLGTSVERDLSAITLSSTFGPRLKSSEQFRNDFHRGIDLPGNLGDKVLAMAAGNIDKIDTTTEGGLSVRIKHPFSSPVQFQGKSHTHYYTLITHLDSVTGPALAEQNQPDLEPAVAAGEQIGTLGQSGSTTFNHNHIEVRIGTPCSLEFQKANPESSCAQGFDPHVHPLLFMQADDGLAPAIEEVVRNGNVLRIRITTNAQLPDFNRLACALLDSNGDPISINGDVVFKEIDINARIGYQPGDIDTLDTLISSDGSIETIPAVFSQQTYIDNGKYLIHVEIDLSDAPAEATSLLIHAEDIWGNSRQITSTL